MKKKTKKNDWTRKKFLTAVSFVVLIVLIVLGAQYVVFKARYYDDVADQANIVQIRELILLAVRGVKKDAPVDYKTGDIYFPESRLYLPNPRTTLPMTYIFDSGNITDSQSELSVSTYPVRGTEKLYSANDVKELFDAVPKLQSCSRGIKLVHQKFPQDDAQNQLKHTVSLSNGETLFVYLEKDCPELNETADLFKNIRLY